MGAAIFGPRPYKILDSLGTRLKIFLLFLNTDEYSMIFHPQSVPDTSKQIMLIFQGPAFQIRYMAGKDLVLRSPPGAKNFFTSPKYNATKK